MRVFESNGVRWYSFETMPVAARHAVFTRLGGASRPPFDELNVGGSVGDDPTVVAANQKAMLGAVRVPPSRVVSGVQVHGAHVALVNDGDAGTVLPTTDALITRTPDLYLSLRFADCVPIILCDPEVGAVGMVHAGWRGSSLGIVRRAVEAMVEAYDCAARRIIAGIGPSIGRCCYEVGPEVVTALSRATPSPSSAWVRVDAEGSHFVDLGRANRLQLLSVGVEHIEIADMCTACRQDEFYSHRGSGGTTGRFAAMVGWSEC